ncbi:MAG: cation diffusion facilitator family transporter [Clostridiales bacterium]|nr:cation diffusion facilitator family transporter [Clostridiales bacterium]
MDKNRNKQGALTAAAGLALNLTLGAFKLAAGIISGSVSVISDSVNNLSDCAGSAVAVSSFAVSAKRADKEHPYGHGRFEYLAGFVIGFIIIFAGAQFFVASVKRIITPSAVGFDALTLTVLAVSVGVKLFMGFFYTVRNKITRSEALKAAVFDSFSDAVLTSVVLLFYALRLSPRLDGIAGAVVSAAVVLGGFRVTAGLVGKLLGNGANPELSKKIYGVVNAADGILGSHDLTLHDYGPFVRVGALHAEFDGAMNLADVHDIVDGLENRIREEMGIELVIHADPIDRLNPRLCELRGFIKSALAMYKGASLHELKLKEDAGAASFHIGLPARYEDGGRAVRATLCEAVKNEFGYAAEIEVDIIYE